MCLCGDYCCSSCGPAQGNRRCSHCLAWASEGGCADPRACEAAERAETLGTWLDAIAWEAVYKPSPTATRRLTAARIMQPARTGLAEREAQHDPDGLRWMF